MQPSRRLKFSIRTLLVGVAVCALVALVYSWLPNSVTRQELALLKPGMTREEVVKTLGQPDSIRRDHAGHEVWDYGFLGVVIILDDDGRYVGTDSFKHF